jgi:hypothetical protein
VIPEHVLFSETSCLRPSLSICSLTPAKILHHSFPKEILMRLAEMAGDGVEPQQSATNRAEADYYAACRKVASGDWSGAREIADRLMPVRAALPPELADAIKVMADILHPNNSPSETAEKVSQILPGAHFHLYDDEHGWNRPVAARRMGCRRDQSDSV